MEWIDGVDEMEREVDEADEDLVAVDRDLVSISLIVCIVYTEKESASECLCDKLPDCEVIAWFDRVSFVGMFSARSSAIIALLSDTVAVAMLAVAMLVVVNTGKGREEGVTAVIGVGVGVVGVGVVEVAGIVVGGVVEGVGRSVINATPAGVVGEVGVKGAMVSSLAMLAVPVGVLGEEDLLR